MKTISRYCAVILPIVSVILSLASCQGGKSYRTLQGGVWNTTYNISYCADRDLQDSVIAGLSYRSRPSATAL